jgi:serine/threonine-protein kinase
MAAVYRGRDTALDREVAVKLLHPHLASAPESRARFSREARAVARLSHPGIVEIFDYAGDTAVESFLVTEFVRGRTLRAYQHEVGFGYPEIGLLLGRALADALVHAHSAGVIHRDLKPENVLVAEGERPAVKLADFGIARILASDERMTMTGALVGSPHHMAPEIVEGREADARSDLFSLGTILYWLSTGKLPFAAANPTAILRRVLEADFEDPRTVEPRVADGLAELIVRLLQVEPERRPGSAAEVREALDRILAECGIERPDEELFAFLRDPVAYQAAFPRRAVTALAARGDAALAEGARARALGYYARVLAIDPANAEVPSKLARLSRRRRARRAFAWGSAVAAAVIAVALAVVLVGRGAKVTAGAPAGASTSGVTPTPTSTSIAPPSGNATATPTPTPTSAEVGDDAEGADADAGTVEPPAAAVSAVKPEGAPAARAPRRPAPALTTLAVHVRPYAQRALLDGVEIARGEQLVRFGLSAGGTHVIQLEHACCAPFVREITAEEAAQVGELRVPLEPRPARLRVEGDPRTRVYVNGKLVGTAADSQRAPFPVAVPAAAGSPYEGPARIGLEAPGAPPRELEVKLRAGGEVVVAAPDAEVGR